MFTYFQLFSRSFAPVRAFSHILVYFHVCSCLFLYFRVFSCRRVAVDVDRYAAPLFLQKFPLMPGESRAGAFLINFGQCLVSFP